MTIAECSTPACSKGWLVRPSPAVRFKENNYSTVIDTGVLYTFPQLSHACMTVL